MKTAEFRSTFDKVKTYDKISQILMWISAALMVAEIISEKQQYTTITYIMVVINCFSLVIFQIISFHKELLQFKAEQQKRMDLYDNSFGTKLSESRSEGYYSNDEVFSGYMKLAVNNFESVFFTYRIMKADLRNSIVRAISVVLLFVCVSLLGLQNIYILMIQITLPITIVVDSIRFAVTYCRISEIYKDYRNLFEKKDGIREADIINQLLNYTATLTAGSVLLNDRTYNRLNESLSKEWVDIKTKFEI